MTGGWRGGIPGWERVFEVCGIFEELVGGDAVDDAVGADLGGIVCEDGQAGADAGLDEDRLDAAVDLGGAAQGRVERRDDRGDDDAGDLRDVHRAQGEEIAEENAKLVDGGVAMSGDAPVGEQRGGSLRRGQAVETEDRIGVAYIDGEEHGEVVQLQVDELQFPSLRYEMTSESSGFAEAAGENGVELAVVSIDEEKAAGVESSGNASIAAGTRRSRASTRTRLPEIQELNWERSRGSQVARFAGCQLSCGESLGRGRGGLRRRVARGAMAATGRAALDEARSRSASSSGGKLVWLTLIPMPMTA